MNNFSYEANGYNKKEVNDLTEKGAFQLEDVPS